MTKLLITRHGETQWNTEKRMQGWSDSPLTAHGIWQAQRLLKGSRGLKVQTVLIVSHGVATKTLMAYFEGRPLEKLWDPPVMEPTALNVIEAAPDAYHIVMYADASHTRRKVS